MSAELIPFPKLPVPSKGNGALEIVRDFFDNVYPTLIRSGLDSTAEQNDLDLHDGDHFLAYMSFVGFKIVPLEADESDGD